MISQTSLDAFLALQASGRLSANQTIVLDVFRIKVKNQPLSDFDLALILNWPINRVTPRRGELTKLGKLVHCGYKRQLETGMRVKLYCLLEDFEQWIDFDFEDSHGLGLVAQSFAPESTNSQQSSMPNQDSNNEAWR